jgi:hypothetical protein
MKANKALIAWTPNTSKIIIVESKDPFPVGWAGDMMYTCGACVASTSSLKGAESIAQLFIDFHTIIVRDNVPISEAHREFLKVYEYRTRISPEIIGAQT